MQLKAELIKNPRATHVWDWGLDLYGHSVIACLWMKFAIVMIALDVSLTLRKVDVCT